MKKAVAIFLIVLSPLLIAAQKRAIVFNYATIIDVKKGSAKSGMSVVIVGGRITAIGETGRIKIPVDAEVVDASYKFLIPGLWDMHVHALGEERVENFFKLFVANGVTGIRDMGTTEKGFAALADLRREIADGTRIGPQIIAAGRILDGAKPAVPPNSIRFSNTAEARQAVAFLKKSGADFIKVYDGVPRESYYAIIDEAKKLKIPVAGHVPQEISSFEASDAGQRSFEHLGNILRSCSTLSPNTIEERVNATVKPSGKPNDFSAIPTRIAVRTRIELESFDAKKCQTLYAELAENKTYQVPTLATKRPLSLIDDGAFFNDPRMKYITPKELENWKPENSFFLKFRTPEFIVEKRRLYQKELELVSAMHRAGVPFMTGTDIPGAYTYPGFSLHDELEILVQQGFTPLEALQAATVNPAKFLNLEKSLGTIEKGKIADLILLDANPLENISNTKKINAVVVNGKLLDRKFLDKMLSEVETSAKQN